MLKRHSTIRTVLYRETSNIQNQRNGSFVSEKRRKAFSQYVLLCGAGTSTLSERATGENGGSFMRKYDRFEDAPRGGLTVIDDFLPPPSQLMRKEDTIEVTSEFTRSSIEFLKQEAKKANVPYEHILRALVDKYVE